MSYALTDFFTDALLRSPMIGTIFMCVATAMVGVIVFISKRSLLGEALSHAAYPGLVMGAISTSVFFEYWDVSTFFLLLTGAFCSAWLGYFLIEKMTKHLSVTKDAALCFVLSSFFGVGVLGASYLQKAKPIWSKGISIFLYGQAATLTQFQMYLYAVFFFFVVLFIFRFYRTIQLACFDPNFAKEKGGLVSVFGLVFSCLFVGAVVICMKSVGVILLSGMLIAPALAACQVSYHLSSIFLLAGFIGGSSAFIGVYGSVLLSSQKTGLIFPTGPIIVLTSSVVAFVLLLFSPRKGRVLQYLHEKKQRQECRLECVLQMLALEKRKYLLSEIAQFLHSSSYTAKAVIRKGVKKGWVFIEDGSFTLSPEGNKKAQEER